VKIPRRLRLLVLLALLFQSPAPSCFGQLSSSSSSEREARPVVVDFLDIGQGDSILVRSPEGKAALIDAGPTRDGAIRTLKSKGIRSIDMVIVTHHHSDHYGGMEQVILNYKPKYFVATGSSHTTRGYLKLLQTVKTEGITAVEPTGKERKVDLGSVLLTVFPQPPTDPEEENNNSIGLRLQYDAFSVLLTGDSETAERQWWAAHNARLVRDCTILKLAHHGSHNGTDQRWLDLVQPELAVASLGKDNEYGHPHSETLSLLRSNDVPLLRTDQRGTITIISNGRTWNVVKPELARRKRTKSDADVASTSGDDKGSAGTATTRTSTRRR